MRATRKRKLIQLVFILFILSIAIGLILYALRQNINLFYTPTQIARGEAPTNRLIRVGGMVVKGSIVRKPKSLEVQFKISDLHQTLTLRYEGILPDLFREGQGIVAEGKFKENKEFQASQVLAKHDANYMPPEVKASLRKGAS